MYLGNMGTTRMRSIPFCLAVSHGEKGQGHALAATHDGCLLTWSAPVASCISGDAVSLDVARATRMQGGTARSRLGYLFQGFPSSTLLPEHFSN